MAKVDIIDVEDLPICPYCEKELNEIGKVARGLFSVHNVYICPYCKKILSVGVNG